jgi:hypothetical protein
MMHIHCASTEKLEYSAGQLEEIKQDFLAVILSILLNFKISSTLQKKHADFQMSRRG